MNIRLFELRDDEVAAYMRAAANLPAGYSISFDTQILSEANIDSVAGCEGIIINNKSVMSAALVERAHELGVRYIAIRCVGFNHVDVKRAQELGIKVCNTAYPPYGVAEFTVMLILMALRRCKAAIWRQQVNDYSLDGLLGRELRTLTVGVVGTGRIGRTVTSPALAARSWPTIPTPMPSWQTATASSTLTWIRSLPTPTSSPCTCPSWTPPAASSMPMPSPRCAKM